MTARERRGFVQHTQTAISLLIFLILRYVRYHNASAPVAATEQFPGSTMRTQW